METTKHSLSLSFISHFTTFSLNRSEKTPNKKALISKCLVSNTKYLKALLLLFLLIFRVLKVFVNQFKLGKIGLGFPI